MIRLRDHLVDSSVTAWRVYRAVNNEWFVVKFAGWTTRLTQAKLPLQGAGESDSVRVFLLLHIHVSPVPRALRWLILGTVSLPWELCGWIIHSNLRRREKDNDDNRWTCGVVPKGSTPRRSTYCHELGRSIFIKLIDRQCRSFHQSNITKTIATLSCNFCDNVETLFANLLQDVNQALLILWLNRCGESKQVTRMK